MSAFFLMVFLIASCQLFEDFFEDHTKQTKTHYGPSVSVGNGNARAWVMVYATRKPTSVGINFSEHALHVLPNQTEEYVLELPAQTNQTLYKHFTFGCKNALL